MCEVKKKQKTTTNGSVIDGERRRRLEDFLCGVHVSFLNLNVLDTLDPVHGRGETRRQKDLRFASINQSTEDLP